MSKYLNSIVVIAVFFLSTCALAKFDKHASTHTVVGWIEHVRLVKMKMVMDAKVDTGADHSSISAWHIRKFTRYGQRWVRFDVQNGNGKSVTVSRRLLKRVRIKTKDINGPAHRRYVIAVTVCFGGKIRTIRASLVDRSHFKYQMLIGRSAMSDILVDPDRKYLHKPDC
jgi:hypothetical protein